MKQTKKDTFIWEGLGFPIKLVNVPMKKIFGEWVLDINLANFQEVVLHILAYKTTPLTGSELRFIIDYLKMSTREFAQIFGVTHTAVLKWENEKTKMNPSTEVCLRLYILNHLKVADNEFRKLYLEINPQNLAHADNPHSPLVIDADKMAC